LNGSLGVDLSHLIDVGQMTAHMGMFAVKGAGLRVHGQLSGRCFESKV
jgi:hypothetical protein